MPGIDLRDILRSDSTTLMPVKASKPVALPEGEAAPPAVEEEWLDDPVPVKLDKIRAAVMNAKSRWEVETEARRLPVGDWLELVAKMMPKQVDNGPVQITSIRIELPPSAICNETDVIEVEIPK